MTTVSQIITDGYRESNLIGKGVTPDATEAADGLTRLQAIVWGTAGNEIGEPLIDWPIGRDNVHQRDLFAAAWEPGVWSRPLENTRLLIDVSSSQTIYLPEQPNDGARIAVVDVRGQLATYPVTLDANGRHIEGALTKVLKVDGVGGLWFYRADLANWVAVAPLTADGEFPFPPEFDDAFVTLLAMRLNSRYGRAMAAESTATLQNALGNLKARYRQRAPSPCDLGVLNLTVQVYNSWNNRGRVPYFGGRRGWMA